MSAAQHTHLLRPFIQALKPALDVSVSTHSLLQTHSFILLHPTEAIDVRLGFRTRPDEQDALGITESTALLFWLPMAASQAVSHVILRKATWRGGERTWPREAAAIGRSEMELKTWAMGCPSSRSIISNAYAAQRGHISPSTPPHSPTKMSNPL